MCATLLWGSMSETSEKFLKLIRSDYTQWLMKKYPWAYLLLNLIALRACRSLPNSDGLKIGEALIGDHESIGATRGQYRHALTVLEKERAIEIIETCRNRKKATTGTTTIGTKVKLLDRRVWNINSECNNHRNNHPTTTEQPPNNQEEEGEEGEESKKDHPSIPSNLDGQMIDDFSFEKEKIEILPGIFLTQDELDVCIKLKGSVENVKHSVAFIQASKRRKYEILDWPNALASWKIGDKTKVRVEDNLAFAEKLRREFADFKQGNGWRCSMHHDRKKDQQGILFETASAYKEAVFIAFAELEFQQKCNNTITINNMRRT